MLLDRDSLALQRTNFKFGSSALSLWFFSYPVCTLTGTKFGPKSIPLLALIHKNGTLCGTTIVVERLRIPDSYDAKITKICNFWTFWHVIQLISHLFKMRQKAFLPNAPFWKDGLLAESQSKWLNDINSFLTHPQVVSYGINIRRADSCELGHCPLLPE